MSSPSRYERAVVGYSNWLLRFPVLTVLLSLASVAALGYGAQFLTFSTDYRVYFSKDNPELKANDELQNVYGRNDNVFVMFTPKNGDVFQPRVLEAVRSFTREAWKLPYTSRVDSITNFQHTQAAGDDLAVSALLPDAAPITAERIATIKAVTLAEPQLLRRLISPNGHVTAVNVVTELPHRTEQEVPAVMQAVRELRDRVLQEFPDVEIALSGVNAINYAFTEASQADMRTLIPAMNLLIVLVTWLMLRSVWATLATLLLVSLSTAAAMGIAGYMRIGLTPPALAAPLVITTLAVADSIHMFIVMFAARRAGRTGREAIVESMRQNFTPVMLTAITTAVGFLTINFTDSPPLRDLGNIAAVGVICAWIYSITLLPALMLLMPIKTPARRSSRLSGYMVTLAEFVLKHRHAVLWTSAITSVVLLACVTLNRTNDNFIRYFDKRLQSRQDNEKVMANLTGFFTAEFSLKADGPNGVADPAYLRDVEAFSNWLRQRSDVVYVATITDVFKRLNRSMHADDPAWYRLPEQRDLAAQYLLLYEMSLPFGLDLNNVINIDRSSTRLFVAFRIETTPQFRALVLESEDWLRRHTPAIASQASGTTVMFSHITKRNLDSMLMQMPLSALFIWVLLLPTLRSLRVGLLALLPLALPTGIAFGVWGLIDGWVNFTMAITLGVITGIVDDDTVHFLSHYLRARREGRSTEDAIRHAFETAGTALLATTAILAGGFLLLAQSAFLPNAGMGQLAAIAIVVALLINLLLLPPMLLLLDRKPSEAREPARRLASSAAVVPWEA